MKKTDVKPIGLWSKLATQSTGATAVEFAMVLPLLLTILFAILKFGLTLGNYIQLTDGVRSAARQLAESRGSSTPYTLTTTALQNGTPGLSWAGITAAGLTVTVNGSPCTSDKTCSADMPATPGTASATLSASYSCDLNVLAVNFAPNCKLTASTTELIE